MRGGQRDDRADPALEPGAEACAGEPRPREDSRLDLASMATMVPADADEQAGGAEQHHRARGGALRSTSTATPALVARTNSETPPTTGEC